MFCALDQLRWRRGSKVAPPLALRRLLFPVCSWPMLMARNATSPHSELGQYHPRWRGVSSSVLLAALLGPSLKLVLSLCACVRSLVHGAGAGWRLTSWCAARWSGGVKFGLSWLPWYPSLPLPAGCFARCLGATFGSRPWRRWAPPLAWCCSAPERWELPARTFQARQP